MDNSTKRLFEVVIDDLDEVLSQAVDRHEREEAFPNNGLDEILSQSLDMFEEVKNSVQDAIDITDMFEFGGPSLVMARRFATKKEFLLCYWVHNFLQSISQGKLPNDWKSARVTPLLKQGDRDDVNNYRPIWVNPVVVFERIVYEQLYAYLEVYYVNIKRVFIHPNCDSNPNPNCDS
ncbi:uncharacterized protein [Montipora capricornis]|uniref:uncharacterized protein n=1 Tax=Montipora capricornis TaxID=246305 RepID=UPI0035F14FCF